MTRLQKCKKKTDKRRSVRHRKTAKKASQSNPSGVQQDTVRRTITVLCAKKSLINDWENQERGGNIWKPGDSSRNTKYTEETLGVKNA